MRLPLHSFHALLLLCSIARADLLIKEPQALIALERKGFGAGAAAFSSPEARDNGALARDAGYAGMVATLRRDLVSLYAKDRSWGVGMRYTHRGFDLGWFTSPHARWELAGVVNRVDRKAFAPGTCGEIRFIYRLAYTVDTRSGPFSSRLPATLNAVFFLADDGAGCSEAAARLRRPLGPDLLARPKSVEVNLQTARWPSTVRPDLGGHADYVLRVFHRRGGRYEAAGLENTPDVERIGKDPKERAALLAWARANAGAIDAGTALLPERFLAMRAVSVTPRGLERPANRPWARLFRPSEFAGLPVAPEFLLRRLDGLTCMGCHQSRSLAGFHLVGEERDPARSVDALGVGVSPHLEEDLPRRRAYFEALIAKRTPEERREPPEHETDRGGFGDACGLDTAFSKWTCAPGLKCLPVDGREVGQCMPVKMTAGSACRPGTVDFARDAISGSMERHCGDAGLCEDVGVGFPGGMCATSCEAPGEHGACGGIAILQPFNECLARGGLFTKCAEHARPAGLRKCGSGDPCRPDYLCSKTPEGGATCLPPYFVLQMRVDGHPKRP